MHEKTKINKFSKGIQTKFVILQKVCGLSPTRPTDSDAVMDRQDACLPDRLRCRVFAPISRKINMEHGGLVTKREWGYRTKNNK